VHSYYTAETADLSCIQPRPAALSRALLCPFPLPCPFPFALPVACWRPWRCPLSAVKLSCRVRRRVEPRCASSSATASAGVSPASIRRTTSSMTTLRWHQAVRWALVGRQRACHCFSSCSTAGPPAMPSLYSRQTLVTV
jgi:hypothetical protein